MRMMFFRSLIGLVVALTIVAIAIKLCVCAIMVVENVIVWNLLSLAYCTVQMICNIVALLLIVCCLPRINLQEIVLLLNNVK